MSVVTQFIADNATIIVAKQRNADKWRIMLRYDDGDVFLSVTEYDSGEEAKAAALEWALKNAVTFGLQ